MTNLNPLIYQSLSVFILGRVDAQAPEQMRIGQSRYIRLFRYDTSCLNDMLCGHCEVTSRRFHLYSPSLGRLIINCRDDLDRSNDVQVKGVDIVS